MILINTSGRLQIESSVRGRQFTVVASCVWNRLSTKPNWRLYCTASLKKSFQCHVAYVHALLKSVEVFFIAHEALQCRMQNCCAMTADVCVLWRQAHRTWSASQLAGRATLSGFYRVNCLNAICIMASGS